MKKKFSNVTLKYFTVGIFILVIALASIYNVYRNDKDEYMEYYTSYQEIVNGIEEQVTLITSLQEDETQYEDNLYHAFEAYYQKSDNEIFKYVFEERFPSYDKYEEDRKQAFVVMYALIEVYPELKDNEDINTSLNQINDTIDKLKTAVEEHNIDINSYLSIIDKINVTDYVTKWHKDLFIDPVYSDITFIETN